MTTHEVVSVSKPYIRIELRAQGEHTFLLMTHVGLPTEDQRAAHQELAH